MWIKLPVDFDESTPEDLDLSEKLGIDIKSEIKEGTLYVNTDTIATFNESTNNSVTLETSGYRWLIKLNIEEFKKRLKT